jgi:hypothetical protein
MKKPHFKLKTNHGNITFKPDDLTGHIAVSRQFLGGFGGWLPNPDGTETDAGLILDTLAPNAGRLNQQGHDLTALLVQDLQRGETEDNILDRLAEQFPNMDDTALQNELARVIFLSGLVGRIEAAQEMS